jgi:hypothetical protein
MNKYVALNEKRQAAAQSDISDDRLRSFKSTLLPAFKAPYYRGLPWRSCDTGFVSESLLRGHLAGKLILGYPGRTYTKFCAVDIDRHNGESDSIIYAQAERIIVLFPEATPVVVQSSVSGGLHIYFFLPQASWSNRAHEFVSGILDAEGIQAEVYPMGTRNFRLPFGAGSFLLDPEDFTPLHSTNIESFKAFLWAIEHGKIEPLEIPEQFRATLTPKRKPQKLRTIDLSGSTSPFMQDIDTLLLDGLQRPGTLKCLSPDESQDRNKQMWLLTWYQKVIERKSDAETVGLLNWWVQTKNNGLSKDWNSDPQEVYKETERIVSNFKPERVGHGLQTPGNGPANDLERYRAYTNTFDLNDAQRNFLAHIMHWANGSETVEIPHQTLRNWGKRRYAVLKKSLIKLGYLSIEKNYSIDHAKCTVFRVNKLRKAKKG